MESPQEAVTQHSIDDISRRNFVYGTLATAAALTLGASPTFAMDGPDQDAVVAQIAKMHDATVKILQDWIALPSIAAENRNYPQGAEYMATLARNAGFQRVDMVPTSGKPGVFAVYDAGAATTLGVYFMYDVKQYDAAEWSSPPLEAKIVERPGVGKICVGRGATNTKGPQTALLAALHAFRAAGRKLPISIVMVCEGEEEIGSPKFSQIVFKPEIQAALQKCVGVIIPLGSQSLDGAVEINLGAKGMAELELVSTGEKWGRGPKLDVHSSYEAQGSGCETRARRREVVRRRAVGRLADAPRHATDDQYRRPRRRVHRPRWQDNSAASRSRQDRHAARARHDVEGHR